jgi:hypothetical protein
MAWQLLTSSHTEHLFAQQDAITTGLSLFSLSVLTTLSIDSSDLLNCFQQAFKNDNKWQEAVTAGNPSYSTENGLVFHKGCLFVPCTMRTDILHSRHDSLIAGHPGHAHTLKLVQYNYSWPSIVTYC